MNSQVDTILREGIEFWLDQGVDGVRIDAEKHIPPGWLKSFSGFIHAKKPAFVFGEWFLEEHESPRDNAAFANESGMSLLHFMFSHSLRNIFHGQDGFRNFVDIQQESSDCYKHLSDQLIFLDNHDMTRFTDQADTSLTDLALTILLTSAGIPLVYYGTEQYMSGGDDPDNRGMMKVFSRETPAYRILSQLNRLRERNFSVGYGEMKLLYMSGRVLVFERFYRRDVALVLLNLEQTTQEIFRITTSLPEGWYSNLLGDVFPDGGIGVDAEGLLSGAELAARSAYVYSYEPEQSEPVAAHFYPKAVVPGSELVIQGRQLGEEGRLTVGGWPANVIFWNSEKIVALIPNLPAGCHRISGTTSDGAEFLLSESLTVWTGSLVTVRVVVKNAFTDYTSQVFMSGNVYELGDWEVDRAVGPFYNNIVYRYPSWYCDVSLPADYEVEFKLFKRNQSGMVLWEKGVTHLYRTPREGVSETTVDWQE